jgi:hypothetical protein
VTANLPISGEFKPTQMAFALGDGNAFTFSVRDSSGP